MLGINFECEFHKKKNKNDKTSSTTEKPVVTEKVTEPETNETTENAA